MAFVLVLSIAAIENPLFSNSPNFSSLATVIGAVTDEQKKPLDYATVALFNLADSSLVKSAITDAAGKFQFL